MSAISVEQDMRGLPDKSYSSFSIPLNHCSTYDLVHSQSRAGVFEGNVPWVHTGSSSSLQGLLSTQTNLGLQSLQERKEIERRFAWWLLAYDLYAHILPNDVRKHVEAQHTSLLTFVRLNGLSMDRIKKLVDSYRGLLW